MSDWKELCERLTSYAQLEEWNYLDPESEFAPLWYATINEEVIEDTKYFVTQEDGGFWLTGELPDLDGRKVRYETLEQAQAGAREHLVRYVTERVLKQIETEPKPPLRSVPD